MIQRGKKKSQQTVAKPRKTVKIKTENDSQAVDVAPKNTIMIDTTRGARNDKQEQRKQVDSKGVTKQVIKRDADVIVKDKHGFSKNYNALGLYETFLMREIAFGDQPSPDTHFYFAQLQNTHLWLFTKSKKLLIKKEISDNGLAKRYDSDNYIVDDP